MYEDYLQLMAEMAVTVVVFLLGIPTLVSQIFLPDDIRRISNKNYLSHIIQPLILQPILLLIILLLAFPIQSCPFFLSPLWRSIISTGLFAAMLMHALNYLYYNLIQSQGYRAKTVEIIQKKILDQYKQKKEIEGDFYKDLEHLGIYSKGGLETGFVIEALEKILKSLDPEIQEDKPNISVLIRSLGLVVANSLEPGSRKNMEDVLEIYKDILIKLSRGSDQKSSQPIYGNAARTIKDWIYKIAIVSIKKDYPDIMPLALNTLTLVPYSSDKLFAIGVQALERMQYQIVSNVLSEIMDRDNEDDHKSNNFLGLIAHLYFNGPASKLFAEKTLKNNNTIFSKDNLTDAMEHHYILTNFPTYNYLEKLYLQQFPHEKLPTI